MILAVLGATGRTGRHVVTAALESGHTVRVLVRDASRLEPGIRERVDVHEGDMTATAAMADLVSGVDAVIMAAGPVKGSPADMIERAAASITSAMRERGVRRLVWLTGAGVIDDRDEPDFSRRVIRGIMKIAAGRVLASSEAAYRIVVNADLDYTVVRPPMLADEPGGVHLEGSYRPPRPIPVGRADLARFLLAAAAEQSFVNESPFVSYRERKARGRG